MSSNQWARPCPRALENRTTEHWRTMHRKSNGNSLVHHEFSFSLSQDFFYEHTEKLHTIFFYAPLVFLEQWMPKKSYFDREDKSDGNPLVHHRIFFFFHKNFPMNILNDSLMFLFVCHAGISRKMNAKNLEIREGRQEQWKPPLLHHGIFFFFHKNFPMHIQNDSLLFFFNAVFVFPELWMLKKLEIREGRQGQWNPTSTP